MARVLVVDDERSVRRTFALFLQDDGHVVETAEDVDQALALLDAGEMDVVVTDIILPRASGVTLMESIAARWPDIKVILVTGEPTVETAASAVRSGAYDYISKPVSSSTIRKVVAAAARVKALQDDNRRLQTENERQRAELATLVELRTAEVRDTREALASTEARLARIASNIPGVLIQFERRPTAREGIYAFGFTFVAESARETFGIGPELMVADFDAFSARVHPEHRDDFLRSLALSAETLGVWTWEGRMVVPGHEGAMPGRRTRAKDEVRWFQAQSRPVRTGAGVVVWDGVIFDTSERKDLQARLMLSDRMASIGTLAAGVAHEINNPLTYILTNLYILSKRADRAAGLDGEAARTLMAGEDTLQLLRETSEGARRVRDIARDLKTFSRSSDEVQPVDVRQVLDSSVRMAINEIRHRARLERDYGEVPSVLANSSRLGQVFLNLIVNAAQAIAEGNSEGNVIRLITTTTRDGWVEIAVSDTGSGIAPDLLERIFDPFVTMKPVGVGTGLGLYICRDIVSHLGGMIEVESQVGVGTTFRVSLPPAPAHAPGQSPRAGAPERSLPRMRILVIDDEVKIGEALARLLPEHDIHHVTNGREAIARLERGESFDLILCDVMMPEMTGREIWEHFERARPQDLAKLVFMTGGAFTERAAEFIEREGIRKIDKPFDVTLIRGLLMELVG